MATSPAGTGGGGGGNGGARRLGTDRLFWPLTFVLALLSVKVCFAKSTGRETNADSRFKYSCFQPISGGNSAAFCQAPEAAIIADNESRNPEK